jgi:hypothetical protein
VRRAESKKAWQIVAEKGALHPGDLILGLPGAVLASRDGAVRLTMHTGFVGLSPYPVIESAVQLRDNPSVDLDFTLDRGRVELVNHKEAGAARVQVHVRQETWNLTLAEPGARVALELSGRWPRGIPFTPNPGPKDAPTAVLVLLVLHGEVVLKHGGNELALHAPPGPALIEWDSVNGQDDTPQRLENLPPWATAGGADSPQAKAKLPIIQRLRQALATKSISATLEELVNSNDPDDRRLAVFVMGALDDLPLLGKTMRDVKHPDVWENGILALRHWIGRGPGQDQILYQALIDYAKYTPVQAATALQFLHSPGEDLLSRPEFYQTLLGYLGHEKLLIRGLAYWHLSRLVPAGRDLGYDPLAPKEAREAAIQKWQKLLPPGQLPPRAGADKGEK